MNITYFESDAIQVLDGVFLPNEMLLFVLKFISHFGLSFLQSCKLFLPKDEVLYQLLA